MTAILGISAFYHDAAAAIVVDGQVIAAAQEERFTRRKHDPDFPIRSIEFCLAQANLEIEDLDHVVFYEKPFLKFERILETHLHSAPRGLGSFTNTMPTWLKSKLHLTRVIGKGLKKRYRKRIIFPPHHESHSASAFFPSPFEQAAILTVDGVGEYATTTMGTGNGNRIEIHKELRFPNSLGLLYSAFTAFCGFNVNGGEGKLMGLAPYGEPIFVDTILENIVDVKADGSFRLDQTFFDYCTGKTMVSKRFGELFGGGPRTSESEITQREKNLAASIQLVAEEILLKIARQLHAETGMKNLCLAGGVALNCVANGRLLQESSFEEIWVQPAAGDSGGAIGAALFAWHQLLGNPRTSIENFTPQLGPAFSAEVSKSFLRSKSAVFHELNNNEDVFAEATKLLTGQKIIGWFQGRMEFGPRALGNRSIIADPRDAKMKDHLNNKIKFREPFRPFAPIILAEKSADYFELDHDSPFMQLAGNTKKKIGDGIEAPPFPAATHVDRSARIQTVAQQDNPKLHGLLMHFENKTGCPSLINTSFNVRGEPIVCTVADAYRCFMNTGLDALFVGNLLLHKSEQPAYQPDPIDTPAIPVWQKLLRLWNKITFPVRWLLSKVVLAGVFILFIIPIGLIKRKIGESDFAPIDRNAKSYWRAKETITDPTRYFKQY